MLTFEDEKKTIEKCQKGDVASFESVYQHFEQPLLRMGLRMLGNMQDAEDATQNTFLRLYKSIGKFNFRSKFSTYLFRIMMNVCYDALNRKNKMMETVMEEMPDPGYRPDIDLKIQLDAAVQSLPVQARSCFHLFAVEGFKIDDVAEILNLKPGTVKAHIFKAKEKLRMLLSAQSEEVCHEM